MTTSIQNVCHSLSKVQHCFWFFKFNINVFTLLSKNWAKNLFSINCCLYFWGCKSYFLVFQSVPVLMCMGVISLITLLPYLNSRVTQDFLCNSISYHQILQNKVRYFCTKNWILFIADFVFISSFNYDERCTIPHWLSHVVWKDWNFILALSAFSFVYTDAYTSFSLLLGWPRGYGNCQEVCLLLLCIYENSGL